MVLLLEMQTVYMTPVETPTTMQMAMNLLTPMVTLAAIMFPTLAGVVATTQMISTLICAAPVQVVVNKLMAMTAVTTAPLRQQLHLLKLLPLLKLLLKLWLLALKMISIVSPSKNPMVLLKALLMSWQQVKLSKLLL